MPGWLLPGGLSPEHLRSQGDSEVACSFELLPVNLATLSLKVCVWRQTATPKTASRPSGQKAEHQASDPQKRPGGGGPWPGSQPSRRERCRGRPGGMTGGKKKPKPQTLPSGRSSRGLRTHTVEETAKLLLGKAEQPTDKSGQCVSRVSARSSVRCVYFPEALPWKR